MIASLLSLSRADIKALRVTDAYSVHRVVYGLYEDVRSNSEKQASVPSGILYADKGGDWNSRKILMLSNRSPRQPEYGQIDSKVISNAFLQHDHYAFEVVINPTKRDKKTGKTVALTGRDIIAQWFINKAADSWGFSICPQSLQVHNVGVKTFETKGHTIIQAHATLLGKLSITERDRFIQSFQLGIGRGRAFGFGLLQLVPL